MKVANDFEVVHDRGEGKMYLVPRTELQQVVKDSVVMTERDARV